MEQQHESLKPTNSEKPQFYDKYIRLLNQTKHIYRLPYPLRSLKVARLQLSCARRNSSGLQDVFLGVTLHTQSGDGAHKDYRIRS